MPSCAIITCKARSNVSGSGISFHRFPKEPHLKEKWIAVTGRVNWFPTNQSTICSKHFSENDCIVKKSGNRYLMPEAIPSVQIVQIHTTTPNASYDISTLGEPSTPAVVTDGGVNKPVTVYFTESPTANSVPLIYEVKIKQEGEVESESQNSTSKDHSTGTCTNSTQETRTNDIDDSSRINHSIDSNSKQKECLSTQNITVSSEDNLMAQMASKREEYLRIKKIEENLGLSKLSMKDLKQIIVYKEYVIKKQRRQIQRLQRENKKLKLKLGMKGDQNMNK